jgi:hypothetical protein
MIISSTHIDANLFDARKPSKQRVIAQVFDSMLQSSA